MWGYSLVRSFHLTPLAVLKVRPPYVKERITLPDYVPRLALDGQTRSQPNLAFFMTKFKYCKLHDRDLHSPIKTNDDRFIAQSSRLENLPWQVGCADMTPRDHGAFVIAPPHITGLCSTIPRKNIWLQNDLKPLTSDSETGEFAGTSSMV